MVGVFMNRSIPVGLFFASLLLVFPISLTANPENELSPEMIPVKERFQARWDALIKRDFAEAYQYESPDYREKNDLQAYMDSYDPDLEWRAAEFAGVEIEDNTNAVVNFNIDSVFNTEWGIPWESSSYQSEEWILEDGEWWHVKKAPASPYAALGPAKPIGDIGDIGGIQEAIQESTQGREDKVKKPDL